MAISSKHTPSGANVEGEVCCELVRLECLRAQNTVCLIALRIHARHKPKPRSPSRRNTAVFIVILIIIIVVTPIIITNNNPPHMQTQS